MSYLKWKKDKTMSNGFDMEAAAKKACEAFDREHGSEQEKEAGVHFGSGEPEYDADGYATCDCGCGSKTHRDVLEKRKAELKDNMIGATITAEIKEGPSGSQAGVIVSLPESRENAYLLLLGIVNTMSIAGKENFDDIITEVSRLNNMGAMSQGEKYVP